MRKAQIKIINKARKNKYSEEHIALLSNEDYTVDQLHCVYYLLRNHQHENVTKENIQEYFALLQSEDIAKYHIEYFSRAVGYYEMPLIDILEILKTEKEFTKIDLLSCICSWVQIPKLTWEQAKQLFLLHKQYFDWLGCYLHEHKIEKYDFEECKKAIKLNMLAKEMEIEISFGTIWSYVKHHIDLETLQKYNFNYVDISNKLALQYLPKTIQIFNGKCTDTLQCKNTIWFMEDDIIDRLHKTESLLDEKMIITMPGKPYKVVYNTSLSGLSVAIYKGKKYVLSNHTVDKEKIWQINADQVNLQCEYWFPYDGSIYYKIAKSKWLPLTLKRMAGDMILNPISKMLLQEYVDQQISHKHYIWKDLQKYLLSTNYQYLPPISIDEINQYHSINEMMKTHYKNADFVNWNKADLIWCFSLMKQLKDFDEPSQHLLLSMKYQKDQTVFNKHIFLFSRLKPETYWKSFYTNEPVQPDDVRNMIIDYFKVCDLLKKKKNLCFTSAKKVKEAHDRLSEEYTLKHTPKVTIPKKSKFAQLRKMLPEEFELITNKKRLVHEGCSMHHCVATYANKINQDRCAIYSVINPWDNRRYTIEFCIDHKNNYFIQQCYGMWDSDCPKEFWEYIESFVKQKPIRLTGE